MVAGSAFFRSGGHVAHAELRRRKAEAQAAQPLARGISQSAVWDAVHERAMDLRVASPTGASSDLAHARATSAHSRMRSPRSLASAARSSGSGATCASTRSRGLMPSRASGRSSGRATCWTRSTGSVGSRRRSRRSKPSSQTSTTRGVEAAVGRARRGPPPAQRPGDRVRARARRRDDPALRVRSDDGGRGAFGRIARPSTRRE